MPIGARPLELDKIGDLGPPPKREAFQNGEDGASSREIRASWPNTPS